MSNYESIVPEDIASNTFDFHRASIRIVADGATYTKPYRFFTRSGGYIKRPLPIL